MTRKDYVKFAGMLKDERIRLESEGLKALPKLVETLRITLKTADIFAADNERFDRDKFFDAVGFPVR